MAVMQGVLGAVARDNDCNGQSACDVSYEFVRLPVFENPVMRCVMQENPERMLSCRDDHDRHCVDQPVSRPDCDRCTGCNHDPLPSYCPSSLPVVDLAKMLRLLEKFGLSSNLHRSGRSDHSG